MPSRKRSTEARPEYVSDAVWENFSFYVLLGVQAPAPLRRLIFDRRMRLAYKKLSEAHVSEDLQATFIMGAYTCVIS